MISGRAARTRSRSCSRVRCRPSRASEARWIEAWVGGLVWTGWRAVTTLRVARTVPVADVVTALGDPDVAADQGEDAEQAQGPAVEPLLGGQGVGLGLLDQDQAVLELAGLEPAGAGEQGPGQWSGPPRPAWPGPWPAR